MVNDSGADRGIVVRGSQLAEAGGRSGSRAKPLEFTGFLLYSNFF